MIAWAEHEFRYRRPTADGSSEADHQESAARQWAAMPAALRPKSRKISTQSDAVAGPPFPDELDYLWEWFREISFGLNPNGLVPALVGWRDIRAWRAEMDIGPLEPWEARALVELGLLRASIAEAMRPKKGK